MATKLPRGQATLGSSVIVRADNFKLSVTNNASQKGSLADPNGLTVDGMRSATVTMDLYVDDDQAKAGAEIAAITGVLNGTSSEPIQIGYKNGVISALVLCTPSQVDLSDKLGDPATFSFTALGTVIDSQGC
jgi:hypothetical protein